MPKFFLTIIAVTLLVSLIIVGVILNKRIANNSIELFNRPYEAYNSSSLNGADVISAINRAKTYNNTLDEEEYEYKIDIKVRIIDEELETDISVDMEKIYASGIDQFIRFYGGYEFKCTEISYNKTTGQVNSLAFENK